MDLLGHLLGNPMLKTGGGASDSDGGGGGDWWADGVAANAYGGAFDSEMQYSYLVIDGAFVDDTSDYWTSLQNPAVNIDVTIGTFTQGAGDTFLVGTGFDRFTDSDSNLDGGVSGNALFVFWAGDLTNITSGSLPVTHTQDSGFGGLNITYSGGVTGIQVQADGSTVINYTSIPEDLSIVCIAAYVDNTNAKLWLNGELVANETISINLVLQAGATTLAQSWGTNQVLAACGWAYAEPSNVPQMQKDVVAYWQAGELYTPS